ncbi:MAG: nucleotidyltransferase domain-containing protein [Spirochaetota bacterium]
MVKETDIIKNEIVDFYNRIKNTYQVKKVLLYGSYATGTAREDSDIDVGVVIDLPEDGDIIKITSGLFHYAREIDLDIEPLCITWHDYNNHDPASILADILRNSVNII